MENNKDLSTGQDAVSVKLLEIFNKNEVVQRHICELAGIDNNLWRQYVHKKNIPTALRAGMVAAFKLYVDTLNTGLEEITGLIKVEKGEADGSLSDLDKVNLSILGEIGVNSLK